MYPHRIRLRGPWEAELLGDTSGPRRVTIPCDLKGVGSPTSGRVRFLRRFGYPGRIDAFERVWLTCAGVQGRGEVVLNDQPLGPVPGENFEFEVTPLLTPRNRLAVILDADAEQCALTGEIALEVRCAAWLSDVTLSLSPQKELAVRGHVLGQWPDPLDLYVLVDGHSAHYQSIRADGDATFEAVVDPGNTVRVELVQGAVVWHRLDLAPIPTNP